MQRTTNFIRPRVRPVRLLTTLVWVLAIAFGGLAAQGIAEIRKLRADAMSLSARINDLAASEAQPETATNSAPEAAEIAELAASINWFNTLIGPRPATVARVLEGLEQILADDVWISQMVWSADQRRLTLSLQSDDETSLPPALSAIESADFLNSVILERQVRLQQGRRTLVQYDIEAGLN